MTSPDQAAAATEVPNVDDMTVDDLVDWLEDQGIPETFCSAFRG